MNLHSSESREREHEVFITGSGIACPANDRADPTIVVSSRAFLKRGYKNVGQALTELPEFGIQRVTQQNQQNSFDVGQSYVNLYSFGPQHVLTLPSDLETGHFGDDALLSRRVLGPSLDEPTGSTCMLISSEVRA